MKFQTLLTSLFLFSLVVGCESVQNTQLTTDKNGNLKIIPMDTVELGDSTLERKSLNNSNKNSRRISTNQNQAGIKEGFENLNTDTKNELSPFSSTHYGNSIVKFKEDDLDSDAAADEIEDSENYSPVDGALLTNSPNDFLQETALIDKSNPLMCGESLFYSAWVNQFDRQWLVKNSQNYKRLSARNKALSQARTNEFIRLVYPAIEKTGYDFPVVINPQVLSWIGYFTGVGRKNFVVWLERGQTLIPKMQKTLVQSGLPSDLVYLSMIESGYSTKALSNVGAVGVWQFMPGTARDYDLKINDWLDERRDPVKATQAASRYLTDLYSRFGSWHLAAAGYNGGPGLVSKTLRNYGVDSSFFELTSKKAINSQTANYVPKILAAMIVAKNASLFGFDSNVNSAVNQTKIISLSRSIALSDLAQSMQIDAKVLQGLNPQLRLGITPPLTATSGKNFDLIVPASKVDIALANLDNLPDAPTNHLVAARIKRHENISAFATRYKLSVAALLKANNGLKSNSSLRKGQVVYISVTLGSGQYDKLTTVKYKHHKSRKSYAHSHQSKYKKSYTANSKKHKPSRVAYK